MWVVVFPPPLKRRFRRSTNSCPGWGQVGDTALPPADSLTLNPTPLQAAGTALGPADFVAKPKTLNPKP